MRPWLQRLLWGLGAVIGGPVAAVFLLYLQSDTWIGQRNIEGIAHVFSGGAVSIVGLGGTFPKSLTADHVEIGDTKGTWLVLDGVSLRWSPWGFLHDNV